MSGGGTGANDGESSEVREDSSHRWLICAAVVAVAIAVGAGSYLIGRSTGEDLDAAKAAGAATGKRAGTAKGTQQGYADGFKNSRQKGYDETYPVAYVNAYQQAFKDADLAPPKNVSVPEKP